MSEGLIFAILGFLVACLFGTIVASFLWRRAVTVTKRSISEDENFASLEEVASLKAELREQQSASAASTREVKAKEIEIASLKEAQLQAETDQQSTTEKLREELRSAGTALETAINERKEAQAALKTEQDAAKEQLAQKEAELTEKSERVTFLETSIRALASNATAILSPEEHVGPETSPTEATSSEATSDETPEEPTTAPEQAPVESPAVATDVSDAQQAASDKTSEPTIEALTSASDDDAEKIDETALDMTRSLEERIEAVKQGQTTH